VSSDMIWADPIAGARVFSDEFWVETCGEQHKHVTTPSASECSGGNGA
jgi:hypothetical protein